MQLKPGGPYSPYIAEKDRQTILTAYADAGFLQPAVSYHATTAESSTSYTVDFDIKEGTQSFVDQVIVLGNDHTRDSVVNRRIMLKPSDPLSADKMLASQQNLYKLGVFDLVRVTQQDPESVALFQNVVVRLEEAKRFTLNYGFGYQTRDRLRGTVQLSDLNAFGWGRRADLRLRGSSVEQSAVLSFQQPQFRFLQVDSYLTFSARKAREVSFDQRRLEAAYQFGRSLSGHTWALLRYNFRNVELSNLKVSESSLGHEDTPRNLSTFSAYYINDTRDNYLDPEKGFFTSTNFGVTTKLLGSNDYYSLFTQNSYYRHLAGPLTIAASFRFGTEHPFGGDTEIPISERFFAGGAYSLRGFDTDFAGPLDPATNQPQGGNSLIIGNLEVRVPVVRSIQLVPFYDTGNVFDSLSAINLTGFSHTLGMGFKIKTPFGPLRADYGYNLNLSQDLRQRGLKPGHFFIIIGPSF